MNNPRLGGNYTEPEIVRDTWGGKEHIEYVAYVGGEEISRWDNPFDAANAVHEGMHCDGFVEISSSNVHEIEELVQA